jgi:hypothetical protein
MSITLPLDEMTVQEKLEAMHLLWEDLSSSQDAIESPDWHEDVLRERSRDIAAGTAEFVDWETAKAALRARAK